MSTAPRLVASFIFVAIAVFLVVYTWVPARASLQQEAKGWLMAYAAHRKAQFIALCLAALLLLMAVFALRRK